MEGDVKNIQKLLLLYLACLAVLPSTAVADSLKDAQRAYSEGDFKRVEKLVRASAEKGDVRSQSMLGAVFFESGQREPADFKEAMKWFQLAAAQGDAPAQLNLGTMYAAGLGVSLNAKEAVRWYRLAGAQGIALAQLNLGMMYAQGYGIPINLKEGVRWYRMAAEQGNAAAHPILE